MTNDEEKAETETTTANQRAFDLEERTARFGVAVIRFLRRLPKDAVTRPLISQLVRSATSIGANYCEADDAVSHKEFRFKICICRKEARETKYWLRMIASAVESSRDQARELWKEAKELNLIFSKIFRSAER